MFEVANHACRGNLDKLNYVHKLQLTIDVDESESNQSENSVRLGSADSVN